MTINIPEMLLSSTFVIDAEKMLAYDGNNRIRTQYTSGLFPWLGVGQNYVTFGGIVDQVKIKRNERCY